MTAHSLLPIATTAQTMGGGLLRKFHHLTEGKFINGHAVRVVWSVDGLAAFAGITALILGRSAVRNPAAVQGRIIEEEKEDERNRLILMLFALCLGALASAVIVQRYLPNMFGAKV